MPLTVNRRIVGVLNVDSPTRFDDEQVRTVTATARLLEQAFTRTGLSSYGGAPLIDLGRHAARVARTRHRAAKLARATTAAGVEVAQLQSAVMWTNDAGSMVPQGVAGRGQTTSST